MVIYVITNLVNGKTYIGQTRRTLAARWYHHVRDSKQNKVSMHRAILKYGCGNFSIEKLCDCSSREEMNHLERLWILVARSFDKSHGYNRTWGGDGGNHTKETLKKMVALRRLRGNLGNHRKGMPLSDEHRKKLSISHAGQGKGRVLSAETKARMSAAQKGRVVSPEQREKLRQANLGKTYSPETNAKKSASLKIAWAKRKAS